MEELRLNNKQTQFGSGRSSDKMPPAHLVVCMLMLSNMLCKTEPNILIDTIAWFPLYHVSQCVERI